MVPRTMVATTVLNGVLGFAALMAILFCAGNIENAENSPTGYPFIEIFYQATDSQGGATAMVCVIVALVFFATISLIATASRMTWAFARDNGLPGSRWLAKVCPKFSCESILQPCSPFQTLIFFSRNDHRSNLARLCLFTPSASLSSSVSSSHSSTSARPRLSTPSFPSAS